MECEGFESKNPPQVIQANISSDSNSGDSDSPPSHDQEAKRILFNKARAKLQTAGNPDSGVSVKMFLKRDIGGIPIKVMPGRQELNCDAVYYILI